MAEPFAAAGKDLFTPQVGVLAVAPQPTGGQGLALTPSGSLPSAVAQQIVQTSSGQRNGFGLQAGSAVGVTNGSGVLSITFPTAFSSTPVYIVAIDGDTSAAHFWCEINTSSLTGFSIVAVQPGASGGSVAVTATNIRVNWMAFGVI